ncbi:HalOD1 output domain-containing protein [Natrialbaceae archaeon AArc-T1-2]|uniref:HalOD1 output domain-containing protein n=1 Tax=Natrialbaceae archaeon AArc-T1-2 TaxID=3053904 RepID=UPI00255B3235|nr:HalOD1 output domain-containing protein [Natrialbaceae archaeon AArc-T1-2]WIV68052.1 hypothetical protein QQ977_04790 [Natrialbaceae archaeon AArc-T1-2]
MHGSETEHTLAKPSLRVVEAIADAEDVHPADLEPPLNDVVDPTALDLLFESTAADDDTTRRGHVSFQYRDYDVTVDSSGTVELA